VRVTLIHNPGAGKQGRKNAEQLVELLENAGHDVRYQSSKDDGWKKALKKPAELVAVAGGDGTVARVARRMAGRGIPVAALPSGTANNISRSLGLVERPFEELVRGWPEARRVNLDVGLAKGPWGERYFVEGIGMGIFARLLASGGGKRIKKSKTQKPKEKVDNALERLKTRAQRMKPLEIQASLDGKDISGRYLLLEAVTIPYVGPNLFLAPDSKPGDGRFDVVLVTEAERSRLVKYLETWQENRQRLAVLPSHRGKHLVLEWTGFEMHIDDKRWPKEDDGAEAPARIEARIDGGVEFLVPTPARRPER
jgi:diacylglycerol kinase (ATP)